MGGNTGNIRTSRLSATSGSRTYLSMIANSNSAVTYCGGTKRLVGYWRCNVNNNINDFYARGLGITYGEYARYNYLLNR
jgi:hypothetical protein